MRIIKTYYDGETDRPKIWLTDDHKLCYAVETQHERESLAANQFKYDEELSKRETNDIYVYRYTNNIIGEYIAKLIDEGGIG